MLVLMDDAQVAAEVQIPKGKSGGLAAFSSGGTAAALGGEEVASSTVAPGCGEPPCTVPCALVARAGPSVFSVGAAVLERRDRFWAGGAPGRNRCQLP